MTDNANAPALPADYFTNQKAREQHFAQTVERFADAPGVPNGPGYEIRQENGVVNAAGPQPNADDLAILNQTAKHSIDGKAAYFNNPKFREVIEKHRTAIFSGQRLDLAAAKVELCAALGLVPPAVAPAASAEPVEPTGSPLDRARAVLDSDGGYLDGDAWSNMSPEARAELAAGYEIDLSGPDGGYAFTLEDAAQLKAAKRVGLTQQQVNAVIRELRKQ